MKKKNKSKGPVITSGKTEGLSLDARRELDEYLLKTVGEVVREVDFEFAIATGNIGPTVRRSNTWEEEARYHLYYLTRNEEEYIDNIMYEYDFTNESIENITKYWKRKKHLGGL